MRAPVAPPGEQAEQAEKFGRLCIEEGKLSRSRLRDLSQVKLKADASFGPQGRPLAARTGPI